MPSALRQFVLTSKTRAPRTVAIVAATILGAFLTAQLLPKTFRERATILIPRSILNGIAKPTISQNQLVAFIQTSTETETDIKANAWLRVVHPSGGSDDIVVIEVGGTSPENIQSYYTTLLKSLTIRYGPRIEALQRQAATDLKRLEAEQIELMDVLHGLRKSQRLKTTPPEKAVLSMLSIQTRREIRGIEAQINQHRLAHSELGDIQFTVSANALQPVIPTFLTPLSASMLGLLLGLLLALALNLMELPAFKWQMASELDSDRVQSQ